MEPVVQCVGSGDEYDWDPEEGPHAPADLEAIWPRRKPDVENGHVRPKRFHRSVDVAAVGRGQDVVSRGAEDRIDRLAQGRVVLDDEKPRWGGSGHCRQPGASWWEPMARM